MRFHQTWLTFLMLTFLTSLQCYHCDRTANVSRPGERRLLNPGNAKCEYLNVCRSPIDSVVTKGDLVGLYNQCVTVSLGDLRVVEQNIYPGETHCQHMFIQAWKKLLNSQWNQVR